jgi:hemolysin III
VPVVTNLGVWGTLALVVGGVLYSIGSITYAMKRPDPFPRIFGYHEVFHTFVIAGSITHFALVAAYVFHL